MSKTLVMLGVVCAACHRDEPRPIVIHHAATAATVPVLPGAGDRAFVTGDKGLLEIAGASSVQVIEPDPPLWCDADARAGVVWFVDGNGLFAFDLEDRQIHHVIDGDLQATSDEGSSLGHLEVVIDWGREKLGGENPLDFDVGVSIKMADHPSVSPVIGCMGDRAVYCVDEHGHDTPAVAALKQRAATIALADPAYVAALARRGAARSLWTPLPPPVPPPAPPVIAPSRCDAIPEACGTLAAIPSSPLWLVTTENSRGDYFHETRELWDPRSGEFIHVDAVTHQLVRSKHPTPGDTVTTDYAGLRVSPAGMSFAGAVFTPTTMIYPPEDFAETCGWASGGWRIRGPTDI